MALTRIRAQQISDIDYKQAVRVITVANVTLSGGAPSTVDGVNLVAGDRILVAGQSTGSQNGLYDVSVLGTGANGTWVRTADGDVTGEIQAGMIVMVTEGTVYRDTQWKLTTNNPIIIGTTSLAFEQNTGFAFGNISANGTAVLSNAASGTVTFAAGDNISITGNNITKTVTIGVTGLSLNSIANGSSNVNVVSSGGDVTIGVGGVGNVGVFSPTGLAITGDLSVSGNATLSGNILGDRIVNGTTSIDIQTASGNANISVGGTSNVTVFTTAGQEVTGAVSATGNITGNYILGNGSQLTGLPATYGNANVVANLAALSSNPVSTTGNVTAGNLLTSGIVSATGNITGGNIIAGGGTGGNITGANVITANTISSTGNITIAGGSGGNLTGANVVSATTLSASGNAIAGNVTTAGTVSATGNITGNYFIGNGSQLTGIASSYGNANVVANLAALSSNPVSTTGNITAGNLLTSGVVSATGNITGGNIITGGGTGGNITGANVITATTLSATGNAVAGNVTTAGLISATGNITGNYFIGNGSQLTGLPASYGNANVVANLAALSSNPVSTTGNVTAGNLLTSGVVSATGNITGANIIAGGGTGGNITGANVITANTISSTGNITIAGGSGGNLTGANVVSATTLSASGNAIAGNVTTAGLISATGNITGNYILGNGSQLTGIASSYGNANVVANLAALSSNPVSTTGNITAGNLLTSGLISVTGNTTLGNLTITGSRTIDVGNNRISNLAEPSAGTDAATKDYVDSVSSSGFTIEDDTANTTVVSGGDTLELFGTANEVEVAVTATDRVTFGLPANVSISNNLSATGNVTGGNLLTSGAVSATGNITGGNIITGGGTGGNITGANVISATTLSATGNAIAGNVTTAGTVSATGNITGNYILGNGSQLTGLPATYGNANVVANLAALSSNPVSTTGNITAGNLSAASNITGSRLDISSAGNTWTISGQKITSPDGGEWRSDTLNNDEYLTSGLDGYINLQSLYANGVVASQMHLEHGLAHITANNGTPKIWNFYGNAVMEAPGAIIATGNITGNYFIGNGSQLTGLPASYGNANVVANLAALSSNPVSTTGNVTAGNLITSGIVSATGNITGANIIAGAGTGGNITGANVITANTISSTGNITIAGGSGGNLTGANVISATTLSATGNAIAGNVTTAGLISAAGNITGNYFIGNGSQLTGLPASYGNANVVANLAALSSNPVSTTGNVTAGNLITSGIVSATGNITGGNLITGGGTGGNITGANVITATTLSSTANVVAGNVTTAGVVSATGNITANYFIGNGSQLTGISSYGNANVVANLASLSSNPVSTTGNITAGNLLTSGVVSATGNVSGGNLNLTGNIVDTGALFLITGASGNVTLAPNGTNVLIATTTGANISGTLNATGNIDAGNLRTTGLISATGNITGANIIAGAGTGGNITGANVITANTISSTGNITISSGSGGNLTGANVISATTFTASGNITANYFIGNGSQLTGLPASYGNANVVANLAALSSNPVSTTGNVTAGNLLTSGIVSATGNITGANIIAGAGTGGNITGANVITANTISSTGNITIAGGTGGNLTGANVISATTLSATGNATAGNVTTVGIVSAIGNITGNYFIGNGSQLTGLSSYGNANVAAYGEAGWAGNIIPSANVTYDLGNSTNRWQDIWLANSTIYLGAAQISANGSAVVLPANTVVGGNPIVVETGGSSQFTANVTAGNLISQGVVSAAGNITGANIIAGAGTGGNITGANVITANTISSTGNITIAGGTGGNLTGANVISATTFTASGNITGNYFIGNGSQLTGLSSYGNANVVANLAALSSNPVSTTGNITGGNILTNGSISAAGNITGSNINSSNADLAENYLADAAYEPGTVVIFGGAKEVTQSIASDDHRVAGVVSTRPSHLMNAGLTGDHVVALALQGRVPCRVSGLVARGDLLVSAADGRARANNQARAGTIIGKALQDSTGADGVIEIAIGRD